MFASPEDCSVTSEPHRTNPWCHHRPTKCLTWLISKHFFFKASVNAGSLFCRAEFTTSGSSWLQKPILCSTSSSSSCKCLLPPIHLIMWDNRRKKKKKHIIISSASLPTFRYHCNSASDVNIWAWFSFNGFNNKIQSNVNIWFVYL